MNPRIGLAFVLAASCLGPVRALAQAAETHMGVIAFPNSGAREAQEPSSAGSSPSTISGSKKPRRRSRRPSSIDPGFALAYWGEAMSYNHPLWAEQDVAAARAALSRLGHDEGGAGEQGPHRAREGVPGGGGDPLRRGRQAGARSGVREGHGTHGRALSQRRRGEGALRALPPGHRASGREGLLAPDEGGRPPRGRPAAEREPPGGRPLHDPLLRRPGARAACPSRRPTSMPGSLPRRPTPSTCPPTSTSSSGCGIACWPRTRRPTRPR